MTETPPTSPTPAQQPKSKLVRVGLADMLATVLSYATPANQALDAAFHEHRKANPTGEPLRDVEHFEVIHAWCAANPREAARIVLAVVYLASGRFVAQESLPPPEAEGQAQPAEGSAADPA